MKQFNLEEYLKNPLKKVVTRDGRSVKIHCANYLGNHPVIAQVENSLYSSSFDEKGRYVDEGESSRDLFFAPEKHEGWVNVYRTQGKLGCVFIYDSEKEARRNGGETAIATVKIEWEE